LDETANSSPREAFEGIHKASGKQIVFIVDEAQHALSTPEGSSALFALKAARMP
jgi:hypothetical protein